MLVNFSDFVTWLEHSHNIITRCTHGVVNSRSSESISMIFIIIFFVCCSSKILNWLTFSVWLPEVLLFTNALAQR